MRYRVLLPTIVALLVAAPAAAQTHAGVRAGVSADPDQFFFGGHVETGPLIERLTFRPNLEVGVGDDVTTIAVNVELVYSVPFRERARLYLGAGPAVAIYSFDRRRGRDSDVGGGFNLLVGAQHEDGLFAELKVGAIDSPNLKFTVGYAFR